MQYRQCSAEQFSLAVTNDPRDKFAKTFIAKANMQKLWPFCMGVWDGEVLKGAVITTVSKRKPKVANLQLLHVFAASRRQGVGRSLCVWALSYAGYCKAAYFRVSAEPEAVEFYERCGFKFWGKQKSGCSLCMYRIRDGKYDASDPVIDKALFSGRKGSLAVSYKKGKA